MNPALREQRNAYKGNDPRAWVRVTLVAKDGTAYDVELIADTGSPFAILVDDATLLAFGVKLGQRMQTTFGSVGTGWMRVLIPEVGYDEEVPAFSRDEVVTEARAEDPDFTGLLGLPVLRMMEYGGDADEFWIRPGKTTP